jgi:hypothetical protein
MENFYTVEKAAIILNCSEVMIRELIKTEQLKAFKKMRKWYIMHDDIINYLKSEITEND